MRRPSYFCRCAGGALTSSTQSAKAKREPGDTARRTPRAPPGRARRPRRTARRARPASSSPRAARPRRRAAEERLRGDEAEQRAQPRRRRARAGRVALVGERARRTRARRSPTATVASTSAGTDHAGALGERRPARSPARAAREPRDRLQERVVGAVEVDARVRAREQRRRAAAAGTRARRSRARRRFPGIWPERGPWPMVYLQLVGRSARQCRPVARAGMTGIAGRRAGSRERQRNSRVTDRHQTTSHEIERYAGLFAKRTRQMRSSAMRDLMAITARPEVISLAGGLPGHVHLPARDLRARSWTGSRASPARARSSTGRPRASTRPSDCIAEVMAAEGMRADPDDMIVTTGGQQVIDLVTKTLVDPGDVVICEAPTYPGRGPGLLELRGRRGPDRDGLRRACASTCSRRRSTGSSARAAGRSSSTRCRPSRTRPA